MTHSIVLGGGCFWCLEAVYQRVRGVTSVVPGYAGGRTERPTYNDVCSGSTGHAEVVKLEFDDSRISLAQILEIFWTVHDPTTPNRQGHDVGTQYRSIVLYGDEDQRAVVEQSLESVAKPAWGDKVVTEVAPLARFYEAEPEQHDYFKNHPEQVYCQIVINPKLEKLQEKFAELTTY